MDIYKNYLLKILSRIQPLTAFIWSEDDWNRFGLIKNRYEKNERANRLPYWIAAGGISFIKDIRYSFTPDSEKLFHMVSDRTTIRHNYDLMEEAYSCILGNLYHAEVLDEPLIYSRNANTYTIERRRYGYQFYTYKMIRRLVDAMYELGLVQGVIGKKVANGQHQPSKIWATDELSSLFKTMGGKVFTKRPAEVIFLKDANKQLRNYRDNSMTRSMRNQLHELNEMLSLLDLTFSFSYTQLSDRANARIGKLGKLRSMLLKSQIQVVSSTPILSTTLQDILGNTLSKPYTTKYYINSDHDAILFNKLDGLEFKATVNSDSNFMRRVFNVDWYHGGRFYEAAHITLPSACRKSMVINGEPTAELDYSGMHIRMLYNQIGVDYRGECYVYEKTDEANRPDRERIKLSSLIVINSDDRNKAIRAIHNECRKKGIHYPAGEFYRYGKLVDSFAQYHAPIKKFLYAKKGLRLQNQDSTIMANILNRMIKQNIPALPVHDSVVCPDRHKDFLRQVMIEEYERIMGFEPVVD